MIRLDPREYAAMVADPHVGESIASGGVGRLIVVSGDAVEITHPGSLPVVVCWLGDEFGGKGPPQADLVIGADDDLDHLVALVEQRPQAAVSLALLLRQSERHDLDGGLAAESAVYSMLQAGPEFAEWRAQTPPVPLDRDEPVVLIERTDSELTITLNRPERHNAVTRQLRDELCAALAVAIVDRSITSVVIAGRGPSFCSGGDLGEFGLRHDHVTGHLTRLAQSPARMIARIADRCSVRIHGTTFGGGIEMAAFAHHVEAAPDTRIGLPEVQLGLIPGAGGTVSMVQRAGRQRFLALALATETISAETAKDWGLVDVVVDTGAS